MSFAIKTILKKILEKKLLILVVLIFFVFSSYYIPKTQPFEWQYMHHFEQAEAFLNLRLDISNQHKLTEVITRNGKYFIVFPPGPTLFILPLFAIFGYDLNFQLFMQIISILCIILIYSLIFKITNNKITSIILTIAFSFGTVFLWAANHLGVWFTNQIFALLFTLLLLNECFGKKRSILMGLYLGLGIISRQLTIFYIIFAITVILIKHCVILTKYQEHHFTINFHLIRKKLFLKDVAGVTGILGLFVFFYLFLNYLKFGSLFATGYDKLIDYAWFKLNYIPWELYQYFFQPPYLRKAFPFLTPPATGQAIIFTTPLFLLVFYKKIKKEILIPIWLTILPIFAIHMLYWSSGGGQLGTRYILDYMPLLFCLLAYRYRENIDAKLIFLTCLSIFFCLSGTLLLKVYWGS